MKQFKVFAKRRALALGAATLALCAALGACEPPAPPERTSDTLEAAGEAVQETLEGAADVLEDTADDNSDQDANKAPEPPAPL